MVLGIYFALTFDLPPRRKQIPSSGPACNIFFHRCPDIDVTKRDLALTAVFLLPFHFRFLSSSSVLFLKLCY